MALVDRSSPNGAQAVVRLAQLEPTVADAIITTATVRRRDKLDLTPT